MFSGIPEIFTETPVESIILATGLKIQMVIAQIVNGTPVLRNIGLICIVFLMIKKGIGIMTGKKNISESISKILGGILLYLASITLISTGTANISFNSLGSYGAGSSRQWNSYNKVNSIQDAANLSNANGLYWYSQIYSSIQQLSNMMTNSVSNAFSDKNILADPAFFMKQMASVASKGLSDSDTAKSLDGLMRDCSDTRTGKKLDANSSFKDVFDLTKPNCQQEWNAFQSNVARISNNIESNFSPNMLQSFAQNGLSGMFVANYQTATSILNYVNSRAGNTDWKNGTSNDAATYTDKGTDRTWQILSNPIPTSAKYLSNIFGGKDSFLQENKAEVATIFNKVSAYIPQLRAYTAAFLAILFVPVVLILGCGQIKWFVAWISAVFMLAMYQPSSAFVYKLGEYASSKTDFMANSNVIKSDPLLLIGSKLIDSQISQILVVTMIAQIGLFLIFVIGSIKFLGSAMSVSGRFSDGGISAANQGISSLARAMDRFHGTGGTSPMDETNIHVHTHGQNSGSASSGSWNPNDSSTGMGASSALSFKDPMSSSGNV
jgi:hypothetical protein